MQLNVDRNPGGPVEVYDLKTDPAERANVAAQRPEMVAKARRLFAAAAVPSPLFPFGS